MDASCASCGRPFVAKRAAAKFCGDTCRKRSQRAGPRETSPVPVKLHPLTHSASPLVVAVEAELAAADRVDTMLGQTSLELARRIASDHETGSAVASLTKQLRETMADALKGVAQAADPLDELRARRDVKRNAG